MTPRRIELIAHPDTPHPEGVRISVDISAPLSGGLQLRYLLSGGIDELCIPYPNDSHGPNAAYAPSATQRLDGLWRHTCFEVFLLGPDERGYREWNFAPSGAWQAYDFRAYRDGDGLADIEPPVITRTDAPGQLQIAVILSAEARPPGKRLSLSAVLETRAGVLSYWALRHAPGQPDFHHTDAFALELT